MLMLSERFLAAGKGIHTMVNCRKNNKSIEYGCKISRQIILIAIFKTVISYQLKNLQNTTLKIVFLELRVPIDLTTSTPRVTGLVLLPKSSAYFFVFLA